jgi:hypothetical protein
MILAGRLTGTLDGRPVVIDADASGLEISAPSLQTAWAMKRQATAVMPLLDLVRRAGIPLRVKFAGLVSVQVLPRPSLVARIFLPRLA